MNGSRLTSLYGQKGTFLLAILWRYAQGSASSRLGHPWSTAQARPGTALAIDGLPASATNYLKAGDYIQLGSAGTAQLL